jgi:Ca2+-transporting ATPase
MDMAKNLPWHSLTSGNVCDELGVNLAQGLSSQEAAKRLEIHGYNEITRDEPISPFRIFLKQFQNVLIIILLIAIALSIVTGETTDAIIIAVIVLFCSLLGFFQEYRAERAIEALKSMLSPNVSVVRDGVVQKILSREVVPGDVLYLESGDKIPADGRIVESYALMCDESALTGESHPAPKQVNPLPNETSIGDRTNMVFAGTTVVSGRGYAVVTETGMKTEFGRIAYELGKIKSEKTPLEKRTEEIGKWLGIISLAICLVVGGVSVIREILAHNLTMKVFLDITIFTVSLAVAAVPEALPAIVTGALAIGMREMAKRNAIIRKMPAVETLGCTTVICSDKTGTLTKGEITAKLIVLDNHTIEVTGAGYKPEGTLESQEKPILNSPLLQHFLECAVLCNNAQISQAGDTWLVHGDPTEGALIVLAQKAGLDYGLIREEFPRVHEIPFSPERKKMSSVHKSPHGKLIVYSKGAPELILDCCSSIMTASGDIVSIEGKKEAILRTNENLAASGLRVLGLGMRILKEDAGQPHRVAPTVPQDETIENDLVFLGLVGMIDPPREEAKEAVATCRRVGIKPIMITGDHALTAVAIAKEVGIYNEGDLVLTGEDLKRMSEEEYESIVDKVTVYARVSPMDKLTIVKAWKKRGEIVAMTGDGVNDAPALKQADIGIAMGISGTEVSKEAADMVLMDDNFATIVEAIRLGRWIYENIKKYLTYLLRCNITEVAVLGGVVLIMGPEYLPLLPAAVLYINLATDGLPALALGLAPPDPDIMERPPRNPQESVFSREVLMLIGAALFLEIPCFFFLFFHEFNNDIVRARTEIFFLFIIMEILIALSFRSLRFSIIKAPPHGWLIAAVLWEIILLTTIIQIPAVRESFGITIPSVADIKLILGISVGVFLSIELLKKIIALRAGDPSLRSG